MVAMKPDPGGFGRGGQSLPTTGRGGRSNFGPKSVNRPLTKAEQKQNTSAQTYKTKGTMSAKQKAAADAASARMKKVQSKARNSNVKSVATAAAGLAAGTAVSSFRTKTTVKPSAGRGVGVASIAKKKGK